MSEAFTKYNPLKDDEEKETDSEVDDAFPRRKAQPHQKLAEPMSKLLSGITGLKADLI